MIRGQFFLNFSFTTELLPRTLLQLTRKLPERMTGAEILVFGVAEEKGDCATAKVTKILKQLEEKPKLLQSWRIGQQRENAVCPTKFSVRSTDTVNQISSKAKRLREVEGY